MLNRGVYLIILAGFLFIGIFIIQAQTNVVDLTPTPAETVSAGRSDYFVEVARGNVPGQSAINKFGHNPAATTGDDVWGGGGVYDFYPTTAVSCTIVSTDADDTLAGSGARSVMVFGLDENWEEVSETVNLTGTTPVNLVNNYTRQFRAIVLTAGTSETNEGDISTTCNGDIGIFINANDGQTQHTIYTIPANKTGYFIKGYVGLADDDKNGEIAEFQWQARPNNGVTGAWAVKGEIGLNNIGSSWWQYEYGIPAGPLPEKTDIRIKVVLATVPLGVVGGFDILLIDDET